MNYAISKQKVLVKWYKSADVKFPRKISSRKFIGKLLIRKIPSFNGICRKILLKIDRDLSRKLSYKNCKARSQVLWNLPRKTSTEKS